MRYPAPRPPKLAELLVRALVPRSRAELILGDLEEDFTAAVQTRGTRAALREYWRWSANAVLHGGRWHREPARRRAPTSNPLGISMMELQSGARSVVRRPAFAAVVVLTLAIATGAATAVFSVVNGVLLKPLPYAEPDQLVTIWKADESRRSDPAFAESWNRIGLTLAELDAMAGQEPFFSEVAGYRTERAIIDSGAGAEEIVVARAQPSLFPLLGVRPALGGWLDTRESDMALLSHRMWSSTFGSDPGVLGRTVRVGEGSFTIAGVLPRTFGIEPLSPFMVQGAPAIWIPVGRYDYDARAGDYEAVARVVSGVGLAAAEDAALRAVSAASPQDGMDVHVEHRQATETANIRGPLFLVLATVGLFVLLASVNVGSLTLGEGQSRQRELATRAALGASRGRITRQLLLESALLAVAGCALGALLAPPIRDVLLGLAPFDLPPGRDIGIDGATLGFAAGLAVLVTLIFGSAPAWLLSHSAAVTARGDGGTSRGIGALRQGLMAAQFALTTVLLVSAALLTRSLAVESSVDPGFATNDRMIVQVRKAAGPDPEFTARVRAQLARTAGVERVAVSSRVPLLDPVGGWAISRAPADGGGAPVTVALESVSDGYFETMDVPLVDGRYIDARDQRGDERVAVVSSALAARLWPDENAVGKTVWDPINNEYGIVGVVGDVHDVGLDEEPEGVFYPALAQGGLPGGTSFIVQSPRDPASLQADVRQAIAASAPGAAVLNATSLERVVENALAADRYRAMLAIFSAAAAALMAAIGLAGVVMRDVTLRLKEFAIRIALGATALHVARIPLRQVALSVMLGTTAGLLGSIAASQVIAAYLFGVSRMDPLAALTTVAVLGSIVLLTLVLALRRTAAADVIRHLNEGR